MLLILMALVDRTGRPSQYTCAQRSIIIIHSRRGGEDCITDELSLFSNPINWHMDRVIGQKIYTVHS